MDTLTKCFPKVTHYMEHGSLFDFLARQCLVGDQALGLCLDIATGPNN